MHCVVTSKHMTLSVVRQDHTRPWAISRWKASGGVRTSSKSPAYTGREVSCVRNLLNPTRIEKTLLRINISMCLE